MLSLNSLILVGKFSTQKLMSTKSDLFWVKVWSETPFQPQRLVLFRFPGGSHSFALFNSAQVTRSSDEEPGVVGLTAAYASPEMLALPPEKRKRIDPPLDMWALGVILHIMLVGCHPFDYEGDATDTKIASLVVSKQTPKSLKSGSPMTAHLSPSAMDLIRKLLEWDPKKRITASEMLSHPWVKGETARRDKISGSDEKLKSFRVFKSKLEAKVFEDIISWAESADSEDVSKRTSLIERSFRKLDEEQKGTCQSLCLF